ncbi:prostasin-like [Penaeus chinensis]|uniref:prostasin-like n=1 Tax=Penaeus chinensis TaxID=139456 RepID=UPI001FB7D0F7|nr:prostasin-like [Penaeus chinensis]
MLCAVLVACALCRCVVGSKTTRCEDLGGRCVPSDSAHSCPGNAHRPSHSTLCPEGLDCCPEDVSENKYLDFSTIQVRKKRTCQKTPVKCSKHGGRCVSRKAACNTASVISLCKGRSCSCCLGDNPKCSSNPKCRFRGGFCFKKNRKLCGSGLVEEDGCEGKNCMCCIARKSCSCGITNDARIVGGTEVVPALKYPWMVGVLVPRLLSSYLCGGTIINDRFVITAAHCLFDGYTGQKLRPEDVKIGLSDHDQLSDDGLQVPVSELIVHELYKDSDISFDVALIRLQEPLVFHHFLRPACLPTDATESYEGRWGFVYGWGVTNISDYILSSRLQETQLLILGPDCDNKTIGNVRPTPDMLCAGTEEGGKDTCTGDSGGPITVPARKRRHVIVGITSFGEGCGVPGVPGVYTRVTSYLGWILEKTAAASYCN